MPRRFPHFLAAGILVAVAVIMSPISPAVAQPVTPRPPANVHHACAWPPKRGHASCMALGRTDARKNLGAHPDVTLDQAYGAPDLVDAYDLPSATAGSGQTVAIVDAFDDPRAEADLAQYRSQYKLPSCTTANGCFKKVFTSGRTPPPDAGWSVETALDLDMVSATCPRCHITLVEADSDISDDLASAESVAMHLSGVHYVSNSWGAPEDPGFAGLFNPIFRSKQGVAVTFSSGDWGYGLLYPASDPYVVAVGGTSLLHALNSRGWDEIAWTGAGSGCSLLDEGGKPPWQPDVNECSNRTVADVSAVADPYTGVYTYNTLPNDMCTGWCILGGTSAAAPIIAGVYALAGPPANNDPAYSLYAHSDKLNDIVAGTNYLDGTCAPEYLCNAEPGYDGPTGLGTPEGIGAFVATTGPFDYWP